MPGQSTMGRQEGQAGEMRGIGGLRPPKPAPHIAIMFHHRIAAMCVCVGALVARLTLVGVEFRRDSDAIFAPDERSEEHTSELQSLMRNSYAVFCLQKKNSNKLQQIHTN